MVIKLCREAIFLALLIMSGVVAFAGAGFAGSMPFCGLGAGNVLDEAMCVGRTANSLLGADEDYFRDMDYGATKHPDALAKDLASYVPGITPEQAAKAAAVGRNNWIVWTAGNDRLWDVLGLRLFRRPRLFEDSVEPSQSEVQPRQPMELSWAGE